MECVPPVSADVAKVALPAEIVPEPSVAAPSLKVTVPETVPATPDVTAAVKVTVLTKVDGFSEDVSFVALAAGCTIS